MNTIEEVRAQADELGIKYHHRAGVEKIQGLINEHLVKQATNPAVSEQLVQTTNTTEKPKIGVPGERTFNGKRGSLVSLDIGNRAEYERLKRNDDAHRVSELIRARITCMNPNKKDWPGEVISVGSRKHGTFKKFIPFDGQPYHIPRIIYDYLCERECSVFYNVRDRRNGTVRRAKLIKEFAIDVLPPLSPKELEDLRRKQAMKQGKD